MLKGANIPASFISNNILIDAFSSFFEQIFASIQQSKGTDQSEMIDKASFYTYFKYPLLVTKLIFGAVTDKGKILNKHSVIRKISELYSRQDKMAQFQLVLSILSFNNEDQRTINRHDVILIYSYFDHENIEVIEGIIKEAIPSEELSVEEVRNRSLDDNADVIWLFLIYLNYLAPFSREDVNYFSNKKDNQNSRVTLLAPQSLKLKQFLEKRFKADILLMYEQDNNNENVIEYDNNISENDENGHESSENDDLEILDSFEEQLTNVISTMACISFQPKMYQIPNKNVGYKRKSDQRSSTSKIEPLGRAFKKNFVGDTNSALTNMSYQRSSSQKTHDDLPTIHETGTIDIYTSENTFECNYVGKNDTEPKKCKIILTAKSMIIEIENEKKQKCIERKNRKNCSTTNSDSNFIYEKIIPLMLIYAKINGKKELILESYSNTIENILLYFDNKSKLTCLMKKVNFVSKKNKDVHEDFNIIEIVGKGSYSEVYLGKNRKTKENVAIKKVSKHLQNKIDSIQNWEVDILKYLSIARHPNIVNIIDIYESSTHIYYITEYIQGVSLKEFNATQRQSSSNSIKTKVNLLRQLAEGIDFLHDHGIIHRDIKPDNILLDMSDENNIKLKIIDFGLAQVLGNKETCSEKFGTLAYIAPEVLLQSPYSFKIDIWSFGIIVYQTVYGLLPFGEDTTNLKEITSQIIQCDYSLPNDYTKCLELQDDFKERANVLLNEIIKKCLISKVNNRPNKALLLFHNLSIVPCLE